jgi:DUF1365 family protein
VKIIAAIHWEALRLWVKGLRLVPRPLAVPDTGLATTKTKYFIAPRSSAHVKD